MPDTLYLFAFLEGFESATQCGPKPILCFGGGDIPLQRTAADEWTSPVLPNGARFVFQMPDRLPHNCCFSGVREYHQARLYLWCNNVDVDRAPMCPYGTLPDPGTPYSPHCISCTGVVRWYGGTTFDWDRLRLCCPTLYPTFGVWYGVVSPVPGRYGEDCVCHGQNALTRQLQYSVVLGQCNTIPPYTTTMPLQLPPAPGGSAYFWSAYRCFPPDPERYDIARLEARHDGQGNEIRYWTSFRIGRFPFGSYIETYLILRSCSPFFAEATGTYDCVFGTGNYRITVTE